MAMTGSLWNDNAPAGHSTGGFSRDATWFSCGLSTLDNALNNKSNVPANATITGLRLYVAAHQESVGANIYLKYGFGGTGSISAYLYGSSSGDGNKVGSSSSDHPSGGVDITGYLNRTVQSDSTPFKLSRSYGEYLAFRFISGNYLGKTYYIDSVKLDITYQAHTHSYTSTVTLQPTCTEPGTTLFDCPVCARGYYDFKIPAALGHSFSTIAAKTATCTEQGNVAYKKCMRCNLYFANDAATNSTDGKSDTSSFVTAKDPNNHSGSQITQPAVAPTCDATGLTEGKKWSCCNKVITAQQTVAALGHNYVSTVVAPTETSHGYTRHTCSRCGHYYDDSYTYLVRWYNEDGSKLLETDSSVPYGTMPTYNGATPTKTATAQYTYTHIGWAVSPTAENTTGLTAVVANINYYARFRADINKYTVTWKNDDGTVLETDTLVPYGNPPDYNGATPTKASTAQYDYTFLGWSAEVFEGSREEENLPTVSGDIIYTAVYLPVVRKYDLDIVAYDCTVDGVVSGTYEYGTPVTVKVKPNFGYEAYKIAIYEGSNIYPTEYESGELTFILTNDTTIVCTCKRASAPIFISPEQQVKMVYIVPAINTIVYQVEGDLPTLETTMHTVDDWHFDVINTDIDTKYGIYAYYEAEQLYINETRIY